MSRTFIRRNVVRGRQAAADRGFSLLELLIASAVFIVVGGAGFALFNQQQNSSQLVLGQVGLNLSLRNAVAQIQTDLASAGSNFYNATSLNVTGWPVGVTIYNRSVAAGSSCYDSTTKTYGASCFDQLTIISAADPSVYPAINATDSSGANSPSLNCFSTTGGNAWGQPIAAGTSPYFPLGLSVSALAANFRSGDQLLFLDSSGNFMTSAVLTQDAVVDPLGHAVKFTFHPTNADGSNTYTSTNPADPLHMTDCYGATPCTAGGKLATNFCGDDWIIKLAPGITYQVDTTTDPSNPTLTRTVGSGSPMTVMEQLVGFKIGATTFNLPAADPDYNYDASTYEQNGASPGTVVASPYNYSLVRAVRVSLIGRTPPNYNNSYKFRNAFDSGPYQVQGTAMVVNPRDLSMNDQ